MSNAGNMYSFFQRLPFLSRLILHTSDMHYFFRSNISLSHLLSFLTALALAGASSFYDNPEQDPLPDFKAQEWGGSPENDRVKHGEETREELEAKWSYDVGSFLSFIVV